MKKIPIITLFLLPLSLLTAQQKTALVIGNATYRGNPLLPTSAKTKAKFLHYNNMKIRRGTTFLTFRNKIDGISS